MRGELISREVPFYNKLTTFSIQIDPIVSVTEYYYPEFSITDFLAIIGGSLVLQMGEIGTHFCSKKDKEQKSEAEELGSRVRRKRRTEVDVEEIHKQEE